MAGQFRSAEMASAGLKKQLKEIRGLMLVGEEFARTLNRLRMAGLSQVEIAQATQAAWKNTGDVMTTTVTQNLSALLDLRNVLGSMGEAKMALPIVTKIGAVLSSSSEGKISPADGQNLAFSMAKALDVIGAARDPGTFEREAGLMAKSITAFQGRVTPRMFQNAFQFARQAKFDLSDDFKYGYLPTLMLENSGSGGGGGGSRGVGPMIAALYRVTNQGYINKKALPTLERLGLIAPGSAIKTSGRDTMVSPMKNAALAAQNPFLWSQQVLMPAIAKAYGATMIARDKDGNLVHGDQVRAIVNDIFRGNQLAGAAMTEFVTKPQNFERDHRILSGAMSYNDAYSVAMKNDPALSMQAMQAQWTNFMTSFGPQIVTDMISIMKTITPLLHEAAVWAERNPGKIALFVHALEGLAAALTISGLVTSAVGLAKAIGLVGRLFGAGGAVASVIAGGAPLAAALGGVGSAIVGLSGVAAAFLGMLGLAHGAKKMYNSPGWGDQIKDWFNQHFYTDKDGLHARTGPRFGATGPGSSPYVAPKGQEITVHTNLVVDGKKMAHQVTKHLANALSGPSSGPGSFDPTRNYSPVGLPAN
jgi:hypothetical protein